VKPRLSRDRMALWSFVVATAVFAAVVAVSNHPVCLVSPSNWTGTTPGTVCISGTDFGLVMLACAVVVAFVEWARRVVATITRCRDSTEK